MGDEKTNRNPFSWLVVIGTSWGGVGALKTLLKQLEASFTFSIIIVIHQKRHFKSCINQVLADYVDFPVVEAIDKEPIESGKVYISSPNYHLLVEQDATLSLTIDKPLNFSRPSVDILFQSAAYAYGDRVIGIVLTGANKDGAQGAKQIKERGGRVLDRKSVV